LKVWPLFSHLYLEQALTQADQISCGQIAAIQENILLETTNKLAAKTNKRTKRKQKNEMKIY